MQIFLKLQRTKVLEKLQILLNKSAKVEKFHELRYRKLIDNLANKEVFKKNLQLNGIVEIVDIYLMGQKLQKKCPACKHPQAYYEVLAENFLNFRILKEDNRFSP